MRSRLLALLSALALTVGGLLVATTGQASAEPAHCSGWNTHPDNDTADNGPYFGNGTKIRTGPYTDCTAVGEGYPKQGIDLHCWLNNSNGVMWFYVIDKATGKRGWARADALHWTWGPINKQYNCYR